MGNMAWGSIRGFLLTAAGGPSTSANRRATLRVSTSLGQAVGQSELALGETHAFLWEEGAMTGITADSYSNATDIADSGLVVVIRRVVQDPLDT